MTAAIIDGKAFAEELRARVAEAVPGFAAAAGRAPGLAVVLVGEDPASSVYVRSKGKATTAAGMLSLEHRLPASATERSEEHTSELQSLMRTSYAVFCLKKKTNTRHKQHNKHKIKTTTCNTPCTTPRI